MTHSAANPPDVSPARLWFGVSAAAVAWVLENMLGPVISSLRGDAVRLLLAAVTVALLAVAVTAGVVSYQNWRRLSDQRSISASEGRNRAEFMALAGVFVSTVFVVGIVWSGIPLFMIEAGVRAR
jgi:hypothetical protein